MTIAALIPWLIEHKIRFVENAPLALHTTLRIGGTAALFVEWPEQATAGSQLLAQLDALQLERRILGAGSDLLVDDAPFSGVVLQMKSSRAPEFNEEGVTAPGGYPIPKLASLAAAEGLAGLEALAGVPGTVGGAVAMNAGCWGMEVKDIFAWAEVVTAGGIQRVGLRDADFSYRHSAFQVAPGALIHCARFILRREHPQQVRQRLLDWQHRREQSQPIHSRTAGSTWTNPPGQKVWQLLDACGLRGYEVGGVRLSEKHCNFLINVGGGSYADAVTLLEEAERRVQSQHGIVLQREIKLWPAAAQSVGEVARVS